MPITSGLTVTIDKVGKFQDSIRDLASKRVMVGIPSDKADREPDPGETSAPLNNAEIGYIMEHGAPEANIPARPFLLPGIQSAETTIVGRLKDAGKAALDGNASLADRNLNAAGLSGQSAVQAKIDDGLSPALSEATLRNRVRSGKAVKGAQAELDSRAAGNSPGTEFAKPLLWTGQLRNAVTYVIRKIKT